MAAWGAAALAVLFAGALLVAWSGVYNVGASSGHLAPVQWFLELGMEASVRTHSFGVTAPPDLGDSDRVRAGAGHFAGGCAPCHGSPAREKNPITVAMLPQPTNLMHSVPGWSPEELFWIVKNGIKYSGMPAWVAPKRDEEIWNVVAFLLQLPGMSGDTYRTLALGNVEQPQAKVASIVESGPRIAALAACARCHDTETQPPASRYVPRLAGQSRDYLLRSLRNYDSGLRPSGMMQSVAATLTEDDFVRLADHYSRMQPRAGFPRSNVTDRDLIERGRLIAIEGLRERSIPACVACHRAGSASLFPRLAGQSATYLAMQLRLWRRGGRDRTAAGRIMASIAPRLDDADIRAVTAYFESLTTPVERVAQPPAPGAAP